jgi:hypothetical protein
VIPQAATPVIKAKISTRHMLEWFPQYCDWKMARPRVVPAAGIAGKVQFGKAVSEGRGD